MSVNLTLLNLLLYRQPVQVSVHFAITTTPVMIFVVVVVVVVIVVVVLVAQISVNFTRLELLL